MARQLKDIKDEREARQKISPKYSHLEIKSFLALIKICKEKGMVMPQNVIDKLRSIGLDEEGNPL